jgi:hypothetical protein
VIILQEQAYFLVNVGQVIDQSRYDGLRINEKSLPDQIKRVCSNFGSSAPDRVGHIEEKRDGSSSSESIVNHATELPCWPSHSDQLAASEVLPNPAGALITASRLAGSWDAMASNRGPSISPGHRGATILVARKGRCFPPGSGTSPIVGPRAEDDRNSIEDIPNLAVSIPPFGG